MSQQLFSIGYCKMWPSWDQTFTYVLLMINCTSLCWLNLQSLNYFCLLYVTHTSTITHSFILVINDYRTTANTAFSVVDFPMN